VFRITAFVHLIPDESIHSTMYSNRNNYEFKQKITYKIKSSELYISETKQMEMSVRNDVMTIKS